MVQKFKTTKHEDTMLRTKRFPQFRYEHDVVKLMELQAKHPFMVRYPLEPKLELIDLLISSGERNDAMRVNPYNYEMPLQPRQKEASIRWIVLPPADAAPEEWWVDVGVAPDPPKPQETKPQRELRMLEARIRNSTIFTHSEELLLAHVYGLFGTTAVNCREFASACGQGPSGRLGLQHTVAALVKRLRVFGVWADAYIPVGWQIQSTPVVEPIRMDIELPYWEVRMEYLYYLTEGKPFSVDVLRNASTRLDWPFSWPRHSADIHSCLAPSRRQSNGAWRGHGFTLDRHKGSVGPTVYTWVSCYITGEWAKKLQQWKCEESNRRLAGTAKSFKSGALARRMDDFFKGAF